MKFAATLSCVVGLAAAGGGGGGGLGKSKSYYPLVLNPFPFQFP
jgi:hypothetical protein